MTAAVKNSVPYVEMSIEAYHAHENIGSSLGKKALKTLGHFRHAELEDAEDSTPSQSLGNLAHWAALEPERFRKEAKVRPKFCGKGAVAAREAWEVENHGKIILTDDQLFNVNGMLESIRNHKTAAKLFTGGLREKTFLDTCPTTGLPIKCRPDLLHLESGIVGDLKTTRNAEYGSFSYDTAKFGYHFSAAWYLDILERRYMRTFDTFLIVAVESCAPWGVAVYELDFGTLEAGRSLVAKSRRLIANARKTNRYPMYPDQIISLAIPEKMFPREDESESEGAA